MRLLDAHSGYATLVSHCLTLYWVVNMLGVRLEKKLEKRLAALAKRTNRSKSDLAKEALVAYLELQERLAVEKQETLDRWEEYLIHGKTIANSQVMDWMASWGETWEKVPPAQ